MYRSDATEYLWSALSSDEGASWHNVRPLNWSWSVRPQLRVTSKGLFVLTSGRPGIDMWVSADQGATWTRFNIAAEHNKLLAGGDPALLFDAQASCKTSKRQTINCCAFMHSRCTVISVLTARTPSIASVPATTSRHAHHRSSLFLRPHHGTHTIDRVCSCDHQ